jgi:cob(I)alamin adenosyltransferase
MKIYTKTGDTGDTSLFGGQRVPKDAMRIEACGTVDELNSIIGVARCQGSNEEIDALLDRIQHDLFALGADLATPRSLEKESIRRFDAGETHTLERAIDRLTPGLKPIRNFILPGGSPQAAHLHLARTVCRRAERAVVRLSRHEDIGKGAVAYLNRLGDLLFVLARYANHTAGVQEIRWKAQ